MQQYTYELYANRVTGEVTQITRRFHQWPIQERLIYRVLAPSLLQAAVYYANNQWYDPVCSLNTGGILSVQIYHSSITAYWAGFRSRTQLFDYGDRLLKVRRIIRHVQHYRSFQSDEDPESDPFDPIYRILETISDASVPSFAPESVPAGRYELRPYRLGETSDRPFAYLIRLAPDRPFRFEPVWLERQPDSFMKPSADYYTVSKTSRQTFAFPRLDMSQESHLIQNMMAGHKMLIVPVRNLHGTPTFDCMRSSRIYRWGRPLLTLPSVP